MPRLFQALILNKIKWFVVDEKKTMKIELPRPTSLSLSLSDEVSHKWNRFHCVHNSCCEIMSFMWWADWLTTFRKWSWEAKSLNFSSPSQLMKNGNHKSRHNRSLLIVLASNVQSKYLNKFDKTQIHAEFSSNFLCVTQNIRWN